MKKFSFLLIISLFSNLAFADCDYSKIVHNPDGSYTYSKELHLCVGQMKQDLEVAQGQVVEYKKAIELKDLALKISDERVTLWTDTSYKLETRLNKIEELKSRNELLYFGVGVGLTILSVWAAGQLRK